MNKECMTEDKGREDKMPKGFKIRKPYKWSVIELYIYPTKYGYM